MAKVKATANKVEKRVYNAENKALDIINYDFDNHYPQRVRDIVNDSGTAKTCLRLYSRFVMGGGVKDKDFYKARINRFGLTVDKFLRKLIDAKGHFDGVAVHINFNANGKPTEANLIPFEYCRLIPEESKENAGKIAVYSDWGQQKKKSIKKTDIQYINRFNLSTVLQEIEEAGSIEEYKGQIYYWTPCGLEYPLAPFDAVLEDMITEAQLKRFKNRTATTNFLASHILITGKAETIIDENGDEVSKDNTLADNLSQFQGSDEAAKILWLERENNEENIELQKVDIQDYDGLYQYTEDSSRDNIIKSFLIPPVLLVRTSGSLGTSKEISDATEYYNSITADDRLQIEEILQDIFASWHETINPSGDYSIIPLKYQKPVDPAYFPYYTKNEIRISNGDMNSSDMEGNRESMILTLGLPAIAEIRAVISDPGLSEEQKKANLSVLFGLDEIQVNQLIGLKI